MNLIDDRNSIRCAALSASLLMLSGVSDAAALSQDATAAAASGDAPSIAAQWQAYDLNFHYFGFSTYYSCTGMEGRLKEMLINLGADRDVRVSASGCFGSADISKLVQAHIKVKMPAAQATSASDSFQAMTKTVNLKSNSNGGIGSGDCELLEQVRDQLLPALKLQVVDDGLHCIPGQVSIGAQTLQVKALVAQAVK
jgi:hypothetical protein